MDISNIQWRQNGADMLKEYLLSVSDAEYRTFHAGLIPGADDIIGVRIPVLRKTAKAISKGDAEGYLSAARTDTYEERIIYGLVLASKKCGADELKADILRYAGIVTNWAENDTVKFGAVKRYREEIKDIIDILLFGRGIWQTRYGLKLLMDFYLDDGYIDYALEKTAAVRSDEYYVYMMQGWLLATAAVGYRDKVFALMENRDSGLTAFALKAAADKMRDSRRISKEDKDRARLIKSI